MAGRKPNHKCACCGKEYYACNYCDRVGYKWLACSPECFAKIAWKYGTDYAEYRPVRTDLTEDEIDDLINAPLEDVEAQSRKELSDYADELEEVGFSGVTDIINREINKGKSG